MITYRLLRGYFFVGNFIPPNMWSHVCHTITTLLGVSPPVPHTSRSSPIQKNVFLILKTVGVSSDSLSVLLTQRPSLQNGRRKRQNRTWERPNIPRYMHFMALQRKIGILYVTHFPNFPTFFWPWILQIIRHGLWHKTVANGRAHGNGMCASSLWL